MTCRARKLQRRCPRLGGMVTLHYCETCGEDTTQCGRIIDCWWEYFDIEAYLRAKLDPEAFERLRRVRTKPKLTSLVELIEQARRDSGR